MKSRRRDQLFVNPRRHEQEKPDRTTQCQFVIGHWSGNHDRISENGASTGSKNAPPFFKHFQSIGKMVHRIDAKERVKGVILERQWGIGVRDFKCYPISLIGAGYAQRGSSDSCLIGVDARDSATHLVGEIPRGSAGATGDFENVMLGSKIEPRDELIVFLYRSPTVLANVLTESLLTD